MLIPNKSEAVAKKVVLRDNTQILQFLELVRGIFSLTLSASLFLLAIMQKMALLLLALKKHCLSFAFRTRSAQIDPLPDKVVAFPRIQRQYL